MAVTLLVSVAVLDEVDGVLDGVERLGVVMDLNASCGEMVGMLGLVFVEPDPYPVVLPLDPLPEPERPPLTPLSPRWTLPLMYEPRLPPPPELLLLLPELDPPVEPPEPPPDPLPSPPAAKAAPEKVPPMSTTPAVITPRRRTSVVPVCFMPTGPSDVPDPQHLPTGCRLPKHPRYSESGLKLLRMVSVL